MSQTSLGPGKLSMVAVVATAAVLPGSVSSVTGELFLRPVPRFGKRPRALKHILLLCRPADVNSAICKSRLLTIKDDATVNGSQKVFSLRTLRSVAFLKFQSFVCHGRPDLPYISATRDIMYRILVFKRTCFLSSVFATFLPNEYTFK